MCVYSSIKSFKCDWSTQTSSLNKVWQKCKLFIFYIFTFQKVFDKYLVMSSWSGTIPDKIFKMMVSTSGMFKNAWWRSDVTPISDVIGSLWTIMGEDRTWTWSLLWTIGTPYMGTEFWRRGSLHSHDKKVEICPFNSSHHVKSEDLNYHLQMCKVGRYILSQTHSIFLFPTIQDRKLLEEFYNQPKLMLPVPLEAAANPKLKMK